MKKMKSTHQKGQKFCVNNVCSSKMRKKQLSSTWIFYIIQLCYHLSLATSQAVVQSNTIVYGNNPPEYDNGYIVLGGAYLAFQDMTTVAMYDTVKVQKGGALYYLNNGLDGFNIISENHILGFFNFENNGTVVVDDRNSTTAGTWKIDNHLFSSSSFINTGSMMFTSSHGDTIEIGSEAVTNTGYIYSKGVSANMPQIFKIGNLANPWYNTGTICLANTSFDLENPIHGGGCITVGENSKFDIGGIDVQQQTVYLSDSTSVLKVTHGQDVRVYGLGNGNGFLTPLLAFESFKYDALTGILHATIGFGDVLHISANIGKGYNSSLFEVVETFEFQGTKYTNYNYLRYNGKPPQKAPDICQPCVEVPSYTFEVPDSYETTNDLGFSETISFFSTYNENHLPMIGTTTIYTPPAVYTITKSDKRTTETDIVSRVTGIDNNNRPFTYYTTIKDKDQIKTIVTKYVTTTISEGKTTMWTTTMTELVSNITTTDSNGKPTTIVTTAVCELCHESNLSHHSKSAIENSFDYSIATSIMSRSSVSQQLPSSSVHFSSSHATATFSRPSSIVSFDNINNLSVSETAEVYHGSGTCLRMSLYSKLLVVIALLVNLFML